MISRVPQPPHETLETLKELESEIENPKVPTTGPVDGQQWNHGKQQHEPHLPAQDVSDLLVVGLVLMQRQLVLFKAQKMLRNLATSQMGAKWLAKNGQDLQSGCKLSRIHWNIS